MPKKTQSNREIRNTKVFHDFFVGDRYEAGIVLRGTEVKAIRNGGTQITEAFARIHRNSMTLYQMYVNEYRFSSCDHYNPKRPRKLLFHKREIRRLRAATEAGGYTLIPTRLYFKRSLIKLELALCKGKEHFDKRQVLKEKIALREAQRAIKKRF